MQNYIKTNFDLPYRIGVKLNDNNYFLSSHRFYEFENAFPNKTIIMFHNKLLEGQKWKIIQKYNGLYYISYQDNYDNMKNWNLYFDIDSDKIYLSQNKKSLFKFEKIDKNRFYIKDALYGYYLNLCMDDKRDINSFYSITTNEVIPNFNNIFFLIHIL